MKLTSKIAASIAAGALAFGMMGLVGCSSEESSTTPTEITTADINAADIEVTNVGFSILEDNTVSYAFTVNNPNEGYIADGVTFTIEGYDADNVMLIGGGETIQEIYPGVVTAAAGTAYMPATESELVRFEVTPLMEHVTWTKTDKTPEQIANMFSITNTTTEDSEAGLVITGTISADLSDGSSDVEDSSSLIDNRQNARVVALLLDAEGNIICGAESPSIMLDASMTAIASVPGLDENGNPVEGAEGEGAEGGETATTPEAPAADQASSDGMGSVASTTFTISFPGNVEYSTYQLVVTPGI